MEPIVDGIVEIVHSTTRKKEIVRRGDTVTTLYVRREGNLGGQGG